jgi:hypothetical protein
MKIKKGVEAVKLMRRLRRDVDKQLDGKNFEELRRYLDAHMAAGKKRKSDRSHDES